MHVTEDIHQKLAYLHQNLKGKHMQWHNPIKREDYSKIVLIQDITEKNGIINLVFDNGSSLNYEKMNDHLLVVDDPNNPPLEKVNAKPLTIKELGNDQKNDQKKDQFTMSKSVEESSKSDLFDLFPENSFDIPLTLKAKLPDMPLLKMMYASSQDKDKFLSSIINKIIKSINEKSIKESIKKQLEQNG